MVTQMWLLGFQMCAVVNRVAVPHLCLRHHHGKSRMPRVVTITDGAKSVGDNIMHQFTHPLAPPRSPFNSHRNATSSKRYKGKPGEFGATRVLLSNTRTSDVTAATAGISNSASYVLSVSCLFLCGPLRRISVNARFYVQCCLVL